MKFYDNLFLSKEIKISKEDIINELNSNKTLYHTYFVVLPMVHTSSQLEIMHAEMYKYLHKETDEYVIVGVALGYRDSFELVREITEIIYEETNDVSIKSYLRNLVDMESKC